MNEKYYQDDYYNEKYVVKKMYYSYIQLSLGGMELEWEIHQFI